MEINKLYLGNSYELIKELKDKSIDLIYTDIPYDFSTNGGGGSFGPKQRDYHKEYLQVSEKLSENKRIDRNIRKNGADLQDISYGIDWKILDEFVRIQPYIYIYICMV